jgi:2-phosphosulfolactate phosphatase
MTSPSEPAITLSVAHAPDQIPPQPGRRARTVSIVVDVIRATTTLAVMFERGVRRVYVARDVAEARARRAALPDALVAGEVAAVPPPDFDHGNSPEEWGHLNATEVAGRDVLFSTTNGARALHASRGGGPIFAGALRNGAAVSHAALAAARHLTADGAGASILIVCSGRDAQPAEDDSLCAAWLIATLRAVAARQETPVALDNPATAALDLLNDPERSRLGDARWLYERLLQSEPARDVLDVGLGADLAWCAALDASQSVPTVTGYDPALDLLIVERA